MTKYYLLNGQAVPEASAHLHVSDLSILRGYGVFDYFMAKGGHPLFVDDYLVRFARSAELMGLPLTFSPQAIKEQVYQLLALNQLSDASIRLVLTGGYSSDGYTPGTPNFLMMMYEMPANIWETNSRGLKIITCDYQRELPGAKTINYSMGIRMLPAVMAAAADDLVYHDRGLLRESARSNIFVVDAQGNIITAAEQILHGVTRKYLIAVAREQGRTVIERDIHLDELFSAQEAFFSSTTKGALSVVQVDGRPIGTGEPGPIVRALQMGFIARVEAYIVACGTN
jgi:branched-chain amino acid aminotransferase